MRKFITIFIIILSLFSTKAHAQLVTVESGPNLVSNVIAQIEAVWSSGAKAILEPLVKVTAERLLDKVTDDVLTWANNGFDGEPGFINNWDGFLENTAYESINQGFQQAQRARSNVESTVLSQSGGGSCSSLTNPGPCNDQYINEFLACIDGLDPVADAELYEVCEETQEFEEMMYDQCLDEVDAYQEQLAACQETGSPATNPGEVAEQNFNLVQSETYQNSRSIERTIINYGAQQFGDDELTRAIEQQGENLTELLGSEEVKRQFESDFSAGGWEGFLALTNPSNTRVGTESLVKAAIQSQTSEDVNSTITDLQTPQRFLDKTRCAERDAEDNCIREETLTPGAQVAEKVNEALFKDEGLAENADGIGIIPLLTSAVGKVTSGLIEQGLAEIGGAASSSVFEAADNVFTNSDTESSNIQSQFDVLGISDDGFVDSSSPSELVNFNNSLGSMDSIAIGGPEDIAEFGQGGAQIIIDFEQNLESAIAMAEEEQDYFNELASLRASSKSTIINLDRCLPGPDFNWEERFSDTFPSGSDEEGQLNSLGLSETRQMFSDEQVNIPGAREIKNVVSSVISSNRQQEAQNDQRRNALASLRSSLSYIRDQILIDFNTQKLIIDEDLVLFYEDWNDLSESQQLDLGRLAHDNEFLIQVAYEDIEEVLISDNERIARAVIAMAWDLWRTETDRERKTDLRYAYYVEQNNLSNEEFIGRIRSQVNQTLGRSLQADQLLRDCLVLRSYTLGTSVDDLEDIVLTGNSDSLEDLAGQISTLYTFPLFALFGGNVFDVLGFGFGGDPDYTFVNTSNARDNDEIRAFLEEEHDKIQNSQESLFLTTSIAASDDVLDSSVLGFNSLEEQEDYYNTLYPMDDFPHTNIVNNRYELSEMFKYDRFAYAGNRVAGVRGVLFCRHKQGGFKIHNNSGISDPDDIYNSVCMRDWYVASDLDYEVAFAGI